MKDCEKFFDSWEALVLGELSPESRRACESHLAVCSDCSRLRGQIETLIQSLKQVSGVVPSEVFFDCQRKTILQRVFALNKAPDLSPEEDTLLVRDLQNITVLHPNEDFFVNQREAVLQKILHEDQLFEEQLRQVSCDDPGEFFFLRQRQTLLTRLPVRKPGVLGLEWRRILVAAAMFVLVLGGAWLWNRDFSQNNSQDWRQALAFLAQDESPDPLGPWVELEDLSAPQLELLARNLSGRVFFENEEIWLEDSQDWDDWNDTELEGLIQHLKEKA